MPWHTRQIDIELWGPDPRTLSPEERQIMLDALYVMGEHKLWLENWRRDNVVFCFLTLAAIAFEFWLFATADFWLAKTIDLAMAGILIDGQTRSCRTWRECSDSFEKNLGGINGQADER